MNRCARALVGACLAAASACGFAHDTWIEPQPGGALGLFHGHVELPRAADASRLARIDAVDAAGRPLALRTERGDDGVLRLRPPAGAATARITATYDQGFWTRTTQGQKNRPMNEVPGALGASHVLVFAKTVLAWEGAALRAAGQPLEIVPVAAPTGGAIEVTVLSAGRPLAGALVASGDERRPPAATDAQGRARVRVRPGLQILSVSQRSPLADDPRADTLSATANLAFVAP